MQRSGLCRSRREFSNEYFLAKVGIDTAESEPCKVCPLSASPDPPRCFVEHDHGDMDAGEEDWRIEAEVPCSSLDSWCRRVVPIENREQKPVPEKEKRRGHRSPKKKGAAEEEDYVFSNSELEHIFLSSVFF